MGVTNEETPELIAYEFECTISTYGLSPFYGEP